MNSALTYCDYCGREHHPLLPCGLEPSLAPVTGSAALVADGVREVMRQKANALGGQQELAYKLKVSPQYVSDVMKKRRDPSAQLAKALGFRRVMMYVPLNGD